MMMTRKRLQRIIQIATQLLLIVAIIVLGGFLLPIYLAPTLADFFSVTTPYEKAQQQMSVQVTNRNASHGDVVTLGISDPASAVQMTSLSYSCDFEEVTLAYVSGSELREVPCDTDLVLPKGTQHQLVPLTANEDITYLPVRIVLTNNDLTGNLSTIIAVAASNADEKSRLSDSSIATLQSFPE